MNPKPSAGQLAAEVDTPVVISAFEEKSPTFTSLAVSLSEIRKLKGVIGYILRSETSALIDLANSKEIVDYAMLSSRIVESSVEIAKQFNIGETESILAEGTNIKVLCMDIGNNKIAIFMEKNASHFWIIKRILL